MTSHSIPKMHGVEHEWVKGCDRYPGPYVVKRDDDSNMDKVIDRVHRYCHFIKKSRRATYYIHLRVMYMWLHEPERYAREMEIAANSQNLTECVRNIEPFAAALNLHANLDYMENLWDKDPMMHRLVTVPLPILTRSKELVEYVTQHYRTWYHLSHILVLSGAFTARQLRCSCRNADVMRIMRTKVGVSAIMSGSLSTLIEKINNRRDEAEVLTKWCGDVRWPFIREIYLSDRITDEQRHEIARWDDPPTFTKLLSLDQTVCLINSKWGYLLSEKGVRVKWGTVSRLPVHDLEELFNGPHNPRRIILL